MKNQTPNQPTLWEKAERVLQPIPEANQGPLKNLSSGVVDTMHTHRRFLTRIETADGVAPSTPTIKCTYPWSWKTERAEHSSSHATHHVEARRIVDEPGLYIALQRELGGCRELRRFRLDDGALR